jgi:hypothetical protein
MRSRFTMTSSDESYSRAGADKPNVGIPHILKHILRISLPARAVNRGPALGAEMGSQNCSNFVPVSG